MEKPYRYSGFISYRHSERQSAIARALQRGLSRYARAFWQVRAVRLFRDETNLAANPDLFGWIIDALDHSENLLLMASPEAAASHWVERELSHWLGRRGQKGLILVLTDGDLAWDETAGVFNHAQTTALPPSLLGRFTTEPLYVDLRWAKAPENDLVDDNPRFSDCLATISAALRNVDKDEIAGEHIKLRRIFRATVAAIITLLISLACGLAYSMLEAKKETAIARAQEKRAEDATAQAVKERDRAEDATTRAQIERNQAEEQRNRARLELARAQRNESLSLAEQSLRETAAGDVTRAVQLALSALPPDRENPDRPIVPRAEFALAKAVAANRLDFAVTPSADWVNDAAFSADGSQIALGTRDGFLKILDADTGREIRSTMEQRKAVLALAYSPDGKLLATAHQDPPSVQVRDAATGTILWSARVKTNPLLLTFTPDNMRLVSAATIQDVRPHIWNARTGEQLHILDMAATGLSSAFVSHDSKILALITYFEDGLFVWDLESGELLASDMGAAVSPVQRNVAVDFSAFEENERIAAGQFVEKTGDLVLVGKRTVYVVEPRARAIKNHWQFAQEWQIGVNIALVSSDAKWVVVGHGENELVAVSLEDGHIISRFAHTSKITTAVLAPSDRLVAALAEDRSLLAWTLNGEKFTSAPTGHAERAKGVTFSRDGARLISFGDKTLRVWDVRDNVVRMSPLPSGWRTEAVDASGSHIFVTRPRDASDQDDNATPGRRGIWSVHRSVLAREDDSSSEQSSSTAYFSASGKWLAIHRVEDAADKDTATSPGDSNDDVPERTVHLFEIVESESGTTAHKLVIRSEHPGFERATLSEGGSKLGLAWATYGDGSVESKSEIEIWDASKTVRLLQVSQAGHSARLSFTSDARLAVVLTRLRLAYDRVRVSIWALDTGIRLAEFERNLEEPESNTSVLDDRARLVMGSSNTPPSVVDLSNGKEIGNVAGKALGVSLVSRSQDYRRLLVSRDNAPRTLWNLETHELVGYVPAREAEVSNAIFTGDGRRILVARRDGDRNPVEVFDAETGKRLKELSLLPERLDLYPGLTGSRVIAQTERRTIEIHDVDSPSERRRINLMARLLRWRMTANDERLVTVDEIGNLQFWNMNTGGLIAERSGANRIEPLGDARLALDRIPVMMQDGSVAVFNTMTGEALWRSPPGIKATAADLAPNGSFVVIRGGRGLEAYDLETGGAIGSVEASEGKSAYSSVSDTGDRMFLDVRGGRSVLFDVVGRKEIRKFENVQLSQLAPSGATLALGFGKTLQLVDGASGEVRYEMEFPQPISKIQFDQSGGALAIATTEAKLIVVDVQSGSQKAVGLSRHVPTWIQFGASRSQLIVYENSGYLTLRDTETGRILTEFPAEWRPKISSWDWIHRVDPTRTYLAVRTPDNFIRVFRIDDGSSVNSFNWDDRTVADLMFTLDGQRLLVATEKGDLLVWNVSESKSERVLQLGRNYRHHRKVLRVTADPAYVLAIDSEGRVDLVSMNMFESRLFYSSRPESSVAATLSEDSRLLATIGKSGILRIWHVAAQDVLIETRLTTRSIYEPPAIKFSQDGRTLVVSVGRERPYVVLLPLSGAPLAGAAQAVIARAGLGGPAAPKSGQKARLGIVMRDVSAERAAGRKMSVEEGVVVVEVMPNSAAVAAGLQRGDVILQVDGKPVTKSAEVTAGVRDAKLDLTLQLLRSGKPITVRAILGD